MTEPAIGVIYLMAASGVAMRGCAVDMEIAASDWRAESHTEDLAPIRCCRGSLIPPNYDSWSPSPCPRFSLLFPSQSWLPREWLAPPPPSPVDVIRRKRNPLIPLGAGYFFSFIWNMQWSRRAAFTENSERRKLRDVSIKYDVRSNWPVARRTGRTRYHCRFHIICWCFSTPMLGISWVVGLLFLASEIYLPVRYDVWMMHCEMLRPLRLDGEFLFI